MQSNKWFVGFLGSALLGCIGGFGGNWVHAELAFPAAYDSSSTPSAADSHDIVIPDLPSLEIPAPGDAEPAEDDMPEVVPKVAENDPPAEGDADTPSADDADSADSNDTLEAADSETDAATNANETNEADETDANEIVEPDSEADTSDNTEEGSTEDNDSGQHDAVAPLPGETEKPVARLPLAPGMIKLMQDEIVDGLQQRRIGDKFARFRRYASYNLDSTQANRTGSEVTGLCRLSWYDHLYRNPLTAPMLAEEFTNDLHESVLDDNRGLPAVLDTAREKMDVKPRADELRMPKPVTSEAALIEVERALIDAQTGYARAISVLSESEQQQLRQGLMRVFTDEAKNGHTIPSRSNGRYYCQIMEKMDRSGLYDAADSLSKLSSPALLDQLAMLPEGSDTEQMEAVTGTITRRVETPAGTILIGGSENNTYKLDEMGGVVAVIDLGGNDVYLDGSVAENRPVMVVIDMQGNDRYSTSKPGAQGAAVMGISLLIDRQGHDIYQGKDMVQGSALCGVGILVDESGNDTYVGFRRVQGQALGGVGLLLDKGGDDQYYAALWSQGMGHPLGFALLDDVDGTDHYYTGGYYFDSYEETPGYDGWGQGVGAGIRQVANGGIGTILDGGGDDIYEFDYLAHGGGYWLGIGFARDFGGNDRRMAATSKLYTGRQRTESRFQRFGTGFGCHYSLGFCFDDRGDDVYHGSIMGTGMAWDMSAGFLCDFGGNDLYGATGGLSQGNGAEAGFAVLFDYNGDDTYRGYGQGSAKSAITYHEPIDCGGNFSFVIDYGGEDTYGSRARNNSYNMRSSSGGFLIDRPERVAESETGSDPESEAVASTSAVPVAPSRPTGASSTEKQIVYATPEYFVEPSRLIPNVPAYVPPSKYGEDAKPKLFGGLFGGRR